MRPGAALVLRANATDLPLEDSSVDLVVTSPPYFALRSYRDDDEHYEGQIGSEPTPAEFLEALWASTWEMVRVLKPSGSLFVNLGDKYAGSGGHNNSGIGADPERGPRRYQQGTSMESGTIEREIGADGVQYPSRRSRPSAVQGIRAKSLLGLPWRYALGCIDDLGLILRAEIVWSKPNGLPESVRDRVRRSHEQWFHLVKEPRYFAAVDEVREPHIYPGDNRHERGPRVRYDGVVPTGNTSNGNPLGKLPGSVWTIPTEPLTIPEWAKEKLDLPDHFAAFPTEWPRRFVLGWSPSGICLECGEGRRPSLDVERDIDPEKMARIAGRETARISGMAHGGTSYLGQTDGTIRRISGYSCACPEPNADTRPAVVLDPFGGTGTTALVATSLGRDAISVDLSGDYSRLARWRIYESGHGRKAIGRTWKERQGAMEGLV